MDETVVQIILDGQKDLRQDLKELSKDVAQILEWKWKLVGATLVVSGGLTVLFQIGLSLIQRQ